MTYKLGKELFNKKVALIATFMMSVFYLNLFFTARILLGIPGTAMYLLIVYYFWKGYVKEEKIWYLWIAGILGSIGTLMYLAVAFLVFSFIIFILIKDKFKVIKKWNLWLGGVFAFLTILPYILVSYFKFGSLFPVFSSVIDKEIHTNPAGWFAYIKFFPMYMQSIYYFVFIGTIIFVLINLCLSIGYFSKNKESQVLLLLMTWIIIPILFHGWRLYKCGDCGAEPRYMLPIFPAIFFLMGYFLMWCYEKIKNYNNYFAIGLILIIIVSGGVLQLTFAENMINSKKESYSQVKEAGEWLKQNSNTGDMFLGRGTVMLKYYSDRVGYDVNKNQTLFEKNITQYNPRFYVINAFEKQNDWMLEYPAKYQNSLKPVKGFMYGDRPIVVIYEFI